MEITINVNDEQFKQLTEDALTSLTKEEKLDICKQGILKTLSNTNSLEKIMSSTYDYSGKSGLAKLLEKAAESIDFSDVYSDVKQGIVDYVKEHKENLAKDFIQSLFINGLSASIFSSEDFRRNLEQALYMYEQRKNNPDGYYVR